MDAANAGLVGTPIRAKQRRVPRWAEQKNRLRQALKPGRQRPGPLEEDLAHAAPESQTVPRRRRVAPGYTLLRATGWKGLESEADHSRDRYKLADVLAATVRPRDARGLGYDAAPPSVSLLETLTGIERQVPKPAAPARVVSDGPAVFDDVAEDDDDGGLDAAAARMQLALVAQRRAQSTARRSELPIAGADEGDRELFAGFAQSQEEHSVAAADGVTVIVAGEKVELEALHEGSVPEEGVETAEFLSSEVRAEAERVAAAEARRVRETGALIEGAVRRFEEKRARALESTRALSMQIMRDKFVSTGTGDGVAAAPTASALTDAAPPKRSRKIDDVMRKVVPWAPEPLLCKRFGVPLPKVAVEKPEVWKECLGKPPELAQVRAEEEDEEDGTQFEISAIIYGDGADSVNVTLSSEGSAGKEAVGSESKSKSLQDEQPTHQESHMSTRLYKAIFETQRDTNKGSSNNVTPHDTLNAKFGTEEPNAQKEDISAVKPTRRKRKSRFRNADASTEDGTSRPRKRKILRAVDFF